MSSQEIIVKSIERGVKQCHLAVQFGIQKSTVSKIWNRYKKSGCLRKTPRSGRPKKTDEYVDKMIVRSSTNNPRLTATDIRSDLRKYRKIDVSVSTVQRRLRQKGLFGRKPCKKPLISPKNRKADLNLPRNISIGLKPNGETSCFRTNPNLTYLEVMAEDILDVLLTQDGCQNTKCRQ